jgi:hypothetical protein
MSLRGFERREFPQSVRKAAFARCCDAKGIPHCENCGNELVSGNIEYEHLDADGLGGEPTLQNCGVWCRRPCSLKKTVKQDNPRMQKADRVLKSAYGLQAKGRPMPGSKASGIRKRMNGQVEPRS